MTQTVRERVAAQLAIAKNTGAPSSEIGRLRGELDELNRINKLAAPAVARMEAKQAQAREAEDRARLQRQNREEREFVEALERHYQDRLNHHRLTRPGVPKQVFDKEVWPEMRRAFAAGKEDRVDRERREKSASVF